MTNADRDAVARLVLQVADRLDAAPAAAATCADPLRELAELQETVRREAHALRVYVKTYLSPAQRARGPQ